MSGKVVGKEHNAVPNPATFIWLVYKIKSIKIRNSLIAANKAWINISNIFNKVLKSLKWFYVSRDWNNQTITNNRKHLAACERAMLYRSRSAWTTQSPRVNQKQTPRFRPYCFASFHVMVYWYISKLCPIILTLRTRIRGYTMAGPNQFPTFVSFRWKRKRGVFFGFYVWVWGWGMKSALPLTLVHPHDDNPRPLLPTHKFQIITKFFSFVRMKWPPFCRLSECWGEPPNENKDGHWTSC